MNVRVRCHESQSALVTCEFATSSHVHVFALRQSWAVRYNYLYQFTPFQYYYYYYLNHITAIMTITSTTPYENVCCERMTKKEVITIYSNMYLDATGLQKQPYLHSTRVSTLLHYHYYCYWLVIIFMVDTHRAIIATPSEVFAVWLVVLLPVHWLAGHLALHWTVCSGRRRSVRWLMRIVCTPETTTR